MRTLGIDPGTAIMGFGLVEEDGRNLKAVEYGCIRTSKDKSPSQRLHILYKRLEEIIIEFKPSHLAVERLFFNDNAKTAMSVGEARGIILLAGASAGLMISEYTPLQVKMAITGYGKADKKQVQQMVKILLKLDDVPKPDDTADALAIAICHLHSYNMEKR